MFRQARHAVLLGAVASLALSCGGSPGTETRYDSLDEALAAAKALDKPLLVDFFTEW